MPDCVAPEKRPCGKPCTEHVGSQKIAWYKDCKTGNKYYGSTYEEVRKKAQRRLEVEASGKLFPGVKPKKGPPNFINPEGKPVKQLEREIREGITPATPSKFGPKSVPPGSRMDDIEDNWQDTEKLLGEPNPDDDPSTVTVGEECFGFKMPYDIPCGSIVIGILALVLVLVAFRGR